jgi:hypothetical protein
MWYAYPKYSNHPDAAAHAKQFQSIWAANHGKEGLSPTEQEQSMIVEFQLSLEGQAARWYAQQDISTFRTFQELVGMFLELFQVKIDPTEVLKEYYSLQQQAGESVADFLLRFRAVQATLDTPPAKDVQKGTTGIATVFLRLDGCFHSAPHGDRKYGAEFGSSAAGT